MLGMHYMTLMLLIIDLVQAPGLFCRTQKKIWAKTVIKWCKTHAMAACFYRILLALSSKLIRRQ
jgi:hypothetical protein